jgi:spore coat protein CotH
MAHVLARRRTWLHVALATSITGLSLSACGDDDNSETHSSAGAAGAMGARGGTVTTAGAESARGGSAGTAGAESARGGSAGTAGAESAGGGRASGGTSEAGNAADGLAAGSSSRAGAPLTGGASNGGALEGGAAPSGGQAGSGGADGGPLPDTSSEIYDPERLPRFDLEVPDESVAALSGVESSLDPRRDEYVRADLRYGDELITNIGVRIKGEGSFRPFDEKPPLKLKFDEFVSKQSFHGLRRLTLNNMVEDPSFLAERLAYELYRTAGLPAPRCNSALLYVNGAFYGVYANVEAEDKTFLSRWFASNDGNLYEEGQKDFVLGAETAFDLETNEAANDRSGLVALIAAVQSASSETFLADLGVALDTLHFLRFTAAEAAVNQWDMYSYTVFYPNNFRIYENPADARFVFLPWGMDMSMKPYRDSGRPHIPAFGLSRTYDGPTNPITAGTIFRKCLASPSCRAAYTEVVRDMADVYENANLAASAERYYAQIKSFVYADERKEYTNDRFDEGYRVLQKTIAERPDALRADLAAEAAR